MRALIMNDDIRMDIQKIIALAKENIFVISSSKEYTAPLKEYSIEIPIGYIAIYTEEKQPKGIWRHLSVSVDGDPTKLPSPYSVEMLMKEFGFKGDLSECLKMVLPCGKIREAINVWEEIK